MTINAFLVTKTVKTLILTFFLLVDNKNKGT